MRDEPSETQSRTFEPCCKRDPRACSVPRATSWGFERCRVVRVLSSIRDAESRTAELRHTSQVVGLSLEEFSNSEESRQERELCTREADPKAPLVNCPSTPVLRQISVAAQQAARLWEVARSTAQCPLCELKGLGDSHFGRTSAPEEPLSHGSLTSPDESPLKDLALQCVFKLGNVRCPVSVGVP